MEAMLWPGDGRISSKSNVSDDLYWPTTANLACYIVTCVSHSIMEDSPDKEHIPFNRGILEKTG